MAASEKGAAGGRQAIPYHRYGIGVWLRAARQDGVGVVDVSTGAPQPGLSHAALGDGREPGRGAVGNSSGGPRGECPLIGVLQRILGKIEVAAQAPDEARQDARALAARELVDDAPEHARLLRMRG